MNYLFLDATYELSLGILSDKLDWIVFEKHSGQKASVLVQSRTNVLLNQVKMKAEDLSGIITLSGPGFYTGLRLSEGLSDVFNFFGIPQYSFYSFEIPKWCGYDKGIWLTKAYRGEYFLYTWSETGEEKMLLPFEEIKQKIMNKNLFIHSESSLDFSFNSLETISFKTLDLLQHKPEKVFTNVLKGLRRKSYYFRPPEDEFKVNS